MIEYRIEDDFDIDVDGYWDMFFSEDYAARMWPAIDIQYELVELERKGEGKDETIHRIQKLTPIRDIPAVLKKVVSGAIAYTEHNEFSRAKSEMTTKTVPSFLAEKLDTQGVYSVVAGGRRPLQADLAGPLQVHDSATGQEGRAADRRRGQGELSAGDRLHPQVPRRAHQGLTDTHIRTIRPSLRPIPGPGKR